MEALLNSFFLVLASEMGDKTQLLAFVLAARFKRPWAVLGGVVVGSFLSHTLAAWAGVWISTWLSPDLLRWVLAFTFLGFAAWILWPGNDEDEEPRPGLGPFLSAAIAFFIGEMGDKTQLTSVALGARFAEVWWVTAGATAAMAASSSIPIFLGPRILRRVSMKWIRYVSALLFIGFALGIVVVGF